MADQDDSATFAVAQARSLADLGDFDKAREMLSKAIEATPDDAQLNALMGWYAFKGRSADPHERDRLAQHYLGVSFQLSPDNAFAHYYQGRMWAEQGNAARARASYEAAVNAKPDFAAAQDALDKLGARIPTGVSGVMARIVTAASGVTRIATSVSGVTRVPTAASGATLLAQKPEAEKPAARAPLIVATVVAALIGAGGYFVLTKEERKLGDLAAQLGTSLPIEAADHGQGEILVDVGQSWMALSGPEREKELAAIAAGAKQLGFKHVYIFSNSTQVAQSREGRRCIGVDCQLPQR